MNKDQEQAPKVHPDLNNPVSETNLLAPKKSFKQLILPYIIRGGALVTLAVGGIAGSAMLNNLMNPGLGKGSVTSQENGNNLSTNKLQSAREKLARQKKGEPFDWLTGLVRGRGTDGNSQAVAQVDLGNRDTFLNPAGVENCDQMDEQIRTNALVREALTSQEMDPERTKCVAFDTFVTLDNTPASQLNISEKQKQAMFADKILMSYKDGDGVNWQLVSMVNSEKTDFRAGEYSKQDKYAVLVEAPDKRAEGERDRLYVSSKISPEIAAFLGSCPSCLRSAETKATIAKAQCTNITAPVPPTEETPTPTSVPTEIPTETAISSATSTAVPTPVPEEGPGPENTATFTPTPTSSPIPGATETPTPTMTASSTPTTVEIFHSPTPAPAETPTTVPFTPTPEIRTATPEATSTNSPIPTFTFTVVPTLPPEFKSPTSAPAQSPTEIPFTPTPEIRTATPEATPTNSPIPTFTFTVVPTLPPEFKSPTPAPAQSPTEIPFTPMPIYKTATPVHP